LLYAELIFHAKINFVFVKINKFCQDNYALKIKMDLIKKTLEIGIQNRK